MNPSILARSAARAVSLGACLAIFACAHRPPPSRIVTGRPPPPALSCGESVPGAGQLLQPGALVLLGEVHGTEQIPAVVARLACQAAAAGRPTIVGLEIEATEQTRIDAFLASATAEAGRRDLLEGPHWRRAMQDGRSSRAMLGLLEQLRQLSKAGTRLRVLAYDRPAADTTGGSREEAMAERILSARAAAPDAIFLVLSGNLHNRTIKGMPWDPGFVPMGAHLRRAVARLISLDNRYADGSAWICTPRCGVHPLRGKDRGGSALVELAGDPAAGAFDGIFYVGAPSASLPAVAAPY